MRYRGMFIVLIASIASLPAISFAQMTWTCATDSAAWSPRGAHASVVFDGKMWVLGGDISDNGTVPFGNDVWWSTNGADWICATDSASWSPRMGHGAVVFHDTMWVIGGWKAGVVQLHDVWYSTDGANWICATNSAPWQARSFHDVVVFNDAIWLTGGCINYSPYYLNDVWQSADGTNWTCMDSSADWIARSNLRVSNFDGKIWVMAGYNYFYPYFNDVWYSTDGATWSCATDSAAWCKRASPSTIVFDNKMWMIGGVSPGSYFNDVWFSTDGVNWTCADSSADWQPRAWHTSIIYDNKMWVIGASVATPGGLNDVWYSEGLGIEEQPIVKSVENGNVTTTIFRGPLQLPEGKKCKVFDITGRIVEPDRIQPGIYFIEVDGAVKQKVVKVR
jgi:hypothetical protein